VTTPLAALLLATRRSLDHAIDATMAPRVCDAYSATAAAGSV
jgi:hypothetical protein